jgi:hypothetical protein
MKKYFFLIFMVLNTASASDFSQELVTKVNPVEIKYDFSSTEKCTTGLENARNSKLKILGGFTIASTIGYFAAQKAVANKIVSMQNLLSVLGEKDVESQALSLAKKLKALEKYEQHLTGLNTLVKELVAKGSGIADEELLKSLTAEIQTVYKTDAIIQASTKAGLKLEGTFLSALKENIAAFRKIENILAVASRESLREIYNVKGEILKGARTLKLLKYAPKIFAFLSGAAFLGIDLFTHSPELETGTVSEMMSQDDHLFNSDIAAKEICSVVMNGSRADKEVAIRKISGVLAVAHQESVNASANSKPDNDNVTNGHFSQ